ncbi:MAG: 3-keto-disaccharide hydrolase [Chitinophagaceae bacterium]
MKALICLSLLLSFAGSNITNAQTKTKNGLSLFDGKTLNGWRNSQRDTLPDNGWYVENRELIFDPAKGHGSDIITTSSFKNFDLSVQFKLSEGGNSGIKYFLLPNTSLGCEYQVIDDSRHADAKLGVNGNRNTGSLYDIMPADPNKPYKPAGEWNIGRIVVKGNRVQHWLNGVKILEYERESEAFKQAIAKSKFKTTKGFAEADSSPILLQAHGDKVSYRNIKIKEL